MLRLSLPVKFLPGDNVPGNVIPALIDPTPLFDAAQQVVPGLKKMFLFRVFSIRLFLSGCSW
jgi:hypothetical protein